MVSQAYSEVFQVYSEVILSEAAGVFSSELIEIIYSGYQIDPLEQATRLYSLEASKEFIEHIRRPIQPQVIL